MPESDSHRDLVAILIEEFRERQRRGEQPSVEEYIARHPELADQIRTRFPTVMATQLLGPDGGPAITLADAGASTTPQLALDRLGDYRILRVLGRGGMGIVYEALQESLGRRVALKVLPNQTLLDPQMALRFRREAQAVARLHHTNIVQVFGVGEHNGLHYFVMQLIQGRGLDRVLVELKALSGVSKGFGAGRSRGDVIPGLARQALLQGVSASAVLGQESAKLLAAETPAAPTTELYRPAGTSPVEPLPSRTGSSTPSDSGRLYWRGVARIGMQVADALAHAHAKGILHRDIKPSNLLLDTQGTVWVTDFGLAKGTGDQEDLTRTGDIVGTVRYLPPERFQGKSDARGDIYALGLTLYELLTLTPAFTSSDRSQLLQQVMHGEPPRPRQFDKAVPRDLETIVLKAIARDPDQRYRISADPG